MPNTPTELVAPRTLAQSRPPLSIVMPAFNEAAGIGGVLDGLRRAMPEVEIIVVDDGSTDGTAELLAARNDVRLLVHPFNRGYGAALKTGMRAATGDAIAWFDSDGEHRVSDLQAMLDRLAKERVAAVLGRRPRRQGAKVRIIGKAAIALLAMGLGFPPAADLNCGLRIFRREAVMPYLSLLPNGFSASLTTTLVLLERRYPVAWQPVGTAPRLGKSKVALRDGFASLALVMRAILLFAPLRFFLPPGLLLTALGTLYGLVVALNRHEGIPVAGMLVTLLGLLMCLLGLLADQLSQLRLAELDRQQITD
ncbi:MAG: glycosyltransferase family 2 protein [Alphaproteobacteria bacterium]|nr:glycosyltransferase family 2 protein [Alphaproteobacteria bacterium]